MENVLKKTGTEEEANYYDTWSEDTRFFIDSLRSVINRPVEEL